MKRSSSIWGPIPFYLNQSVEGFRFALDVKYYSLIRSANDHRIWCPESRWEDSIKKMGRRKQLWRKAMCSSTWETSSKALEIGVKMDQNQPEGERSILSFEHAYMDLGCVCQISEFCHVGRNNIYVTYKDFVELTHELTHFLKKCHYWDYIKRNWENVTKD